MINRTILVVFSLFFSIPQGFSQDWHEYFPSKIGTSWEMTSYNDKSKVQSIASYTLLSRTGNTIEMSMRMIDEKGKEIVNAKPTVSFDGESINFDMRDLFPASKIQENRDVELKFTGDKMMYPTKLIPNTSMPDASSKMEVYMNGMNIMTTNIKIYDRMVGNKEQVTTPAGTFETIKLSSSSETKMMMTMKSKVTSWLSPHKGMVKMESYNDKGKLISSQVMTKFSE